MAPDSTFPKTAYLALWFPLLSETFVYYELAGLWKRGLPVSVVALYGERRRYLSDEMRKGNMPVRRLGIPAILPIAAAVIKRLVRQPKKVGGLLRTILLAPWRDVEMRLENYWAFCCGVYLADKFVKAGIRHVHGAWASGPATAAWVVNQLEGISYSFTARAQDVRPSDGFLAEKLADCSFARADSSFNVPHLRACLPESERGKVHLVYNTCTLSQEKMAPVSMESPVRLVAIGRLIEKKGFVYLLKAARLLVAEGVDVRVTIVGGGGQMRALKAEAEGLGDRVNLAGPMPHDRISGVLMESDVLVMPSIVPEGTEKSDGLPTVIVEAMCLGVPVVATDVASISDVVANGETGLLVPQKDERALADAVKTLARDREKALAMATEARRRIAENFSEENTVGRMARLFASLGPDGQNAPAPANDDEVASPSDAAKNAAKDAGTNAVSEAENDDRGDDA